MLQFHEKVFDTYISGTQNVYTDTALSELLGSTERLSIVGLAVGSSGTNPTLTIQIEHSPDGTRWFNQGSTPELNNMALSGFVIFLDSANNVPMCGHVRLRITLGGTSPAVHLSLSAIGKSPAG
jgi:hypothetical protein